MKTWKCILTVLALVALASTAVAQVHGPNISVWHNQEADQVFATGSGLMTAYVYAKYCETTITGMAFRLQLDPGLTFVGATYPADAIYFGNIVGNGVAMGMSTARSCFGEQAVLACTIRYTCGTQLLNNAAISVVDHLLPQDAGIHITDQNYERIAVTGGTAYVTVTVGTEESTWGEVKNLYR
jgi:hypothetical protein